MSIKLKQLVSYILTGLIIFNPYLAWKISPSGLVAKAAEEQDQSANCYQIENPDCIAGEKEEGPFIEEGLDENQKKLLAGLSSINKVSAGLDVYYGNQPRLIMNSTDIQILKSKLDFSQAKKLFGTADDLVLTKLANDIKEADTSRAIELIKAALKELSDPRVKLTVNSALSSIENSQNSDLPPEEQNSYIQGAKDQIYDLAASHNYAYQDPKLEKYKNLQLDRRTLETLIYLITPSFQGGAGHERIKVERIWKDFEREGQSTKNHPQMETNEESPHYKGQALDIAEIDTIKCTLIKKKRIGRDKKIPQAPLPIKVKYQTKEGAAEAVPPYGETMNDIFKNLSSGSLYEALVGLGLVTELNQEDLKAASVEDLGYFLGANFIQSLLSTGKLPPSSDMKNTLENLGAAYIENEIGLPRGTFTGSSYNEMLENLGRRDLEDKLRLPAGSLNGNTGDEILAQTGRSHYEHQLENNASAIRDNYHSAQIDEALGLPEGAFNKIQAGNTAIYRDIGIKIISERFSTNVRARGIIKSFLRTEGVELYGWSKTTLPVIVVNSAHYNQVTAGFQTDYQENYKPACERQGGNPSLSYPELSLSSPQIIKATYHCRQNYAEQDLPHGTIIALTGMDDGDFSRIFKGTGSNEVFRHQGRKILYHQLRGSRLSQQKEQEFLSEHPELMEIKGSIEFRKTALNHSKRNLESAKKIIDEFKELRENAEFSNAYNNTMELLNRIPRSPTPNNIKNVVRNAQRMLDIMEAQMGKDYSDQKKAQLKQYLDQAQYYLRAAIEGEYQPLTQAEERQAGQAPLEKNKYKKLYKKNRALIQSLKEIFRGQKKPTQAALTYGSRELAINLQLPYDSFSFLLDESPLITPNSFYQSVGRAKIKEILGEETPRHAASKTNPITIDRRLGLYRGDTAKLLSGELSQNEYNQRVGRQALKHTVIAKAMAANFNVGDYFLTPDDIYNLLSGNNREVFNKIAGIKLDTELRLKPGRGETLFSARNTQERKLALAQIGADRIGALLDMPPFDITGNITRNIASARIERSLGLTPGSIRENETLDKLVQRNGAITFAQSFRIPLPFSTDYTREKFQTDLNLTSQIETPKNKEAIAKAKQNLSHYNQAVKNQIAEIRQANSVWWDPDQTQKAIQRFQASIRQIDHLLYIDNGSTKKLLIGEYSLKDYLNEASDQKNTLDYIVRNSNVIQNKIADISYWLADQLELTDGNYSYRTDFANMTSVFLTNVAGGQVSSEQVVNLLSYSVDQQFAFSPGSFSKIIYQPEHRTDILITEGMKKLDEQLGLKDKTWNFESIYDKHSREQMDINYRYIAEDIMADKIVEEIANITKNNRYTGGITISKTDAKMLIKGDNRILTAISSAYLTSEMGLFEHQGRRIPGELVPSYSDFHAAIFGTAADQNKIKQVGQSAYQDAMNEFNNQEIAQLNQSEAMRVEETRLIKLYQKNLQYKIMDSQIWKLDQNIPISFSVAIDGQEQRMTFSQAMIEGSSKVKTTALLYYVENSISLGNLNLPTGTLDALNNWRQNRTEENYRRLKQTGIFGSLDNYLIETDMLGFRPQRGTAQGLFEFAKSGFNDFSHLERIYNDWAKNTIFSMADSKLGLPGGTAWQLYDKYQTFNNALKAYKSAKESGDILGSLGAAQQADKAKTDLQSFVVGLIVNEVFGDQLTALDQKLGLVPGTMVMAVSGAISAAFLGIDPATTLVIILVINLFGTYKTKLICSADGYYPGIASAPVEPSLNLGLGGFDGMNTQSYQAGVMRAAQAKTNDLISDMMSMGYHYKNGANFSKEPYNKPDDLTKPIQIITFRQEDLDSFFGTRQYREVFNSDPPSDENRQGIGISDLIPHLIHIGF